MSVPHISERKKTISWTRTHPEPSIIHGPTPEAGIMTDTLVTAILDAVPHAVMGLHNRSIFFANGAVETVFGWKPGELIGGTCRVLYHSDDDYEEMGHRLSQALEDHGTHQSFFTHRHRDGRSIICRIHVSRIGNHLKDEMVVAAFEDITEQRAKENRSEEKLRRSEQEKGVILDAMTDHVLLLDKDMKIIWSNVSLQNYFHCKAKALAGKFCYEALYQRNAVCPACPSFQAISTGRPHEYERTDSSGKIWTFRGYPVFGSDGITIGAVEIVTDITERKKMEEEKKRLTNQLNQAQKMEAIGTLAGGIAHDFNNLLTGIQGYTSLMLMKPDPDHDYHEKLKAIEKQVQSGADLTKQLLGFARGRRYEVNPVNMNNAISKSAALFGRTKKEIRIHEKYARDLWIVEADLGQMEQVFLNLFVNAWQAMPGGGSLYLETQNITLDTSYLKPYDVTPGPYVKMSVTDTGVGMDELTLQRIFDPFFTTKEMGRGTGLGLASAYGIIKGHGGFINVYSEKGHGTVFNIYLPASEKALIEPALNVQVIQKGTETVLIVDDEKVITEVTGAMLEGLGYRILLAGSGEEAVDIYQAKRDQIDLVIMDMIMPGIGGGGAFDAIRIIHPEAKVILSSGYSMNSMANEILNRGVQGFLQKPFRLSDLSQKIREVLQADG